MTKSLKHTEAFCHLKVNFSHFKGEPASEINSMLNYVYFISIGIQLLLN